MSTRQARGRPRERPRPGLTPEIIVSAGRRLIERDGLDALTMRAVAADLNTAATSLYRHIADRESLLLAILESIALGLPVEVPGATPRDRLLTRFTAAHDYMAECSWVLHVLVLGEMTGENAFPFSNACLADFLDAGLTTRQAARAFRSCWHFMVGELLDAHPRLAPREPSQRSRAVARIDPARLPALAAVSALPREDSREAFVAALDILVSGLVR
ncbi:TetR/AcrR family transcriptional regulator C-terminal domain-containing protein [Actinoplanes sp. NPDC051851]|uniref:TetR/AcrR family transcriptional regulator n=1 Tax=Actinoplanes sp. NPDC051851 TaxID=3154753 RepID=UPI0034464EB9